MAEQKYQDAEDYAWAMAQRSMDRSFQSARQVMPYDDFKKLVQQVCRWKADFDRNPKGAS